MVSILFFSFLLSFSFLSFFCPSLSLSLSLYSFLFRAGRQISTQDKHAGDRMCVTWGAVPSSVVALSAGCQGGRRPWRKRGPRGTRRRTPRWFHAIKTVRFLQQLRIAAPPTTNVQTSVLSNIRVEEVAVRRPASVVGFKGRVSFDRGLRMNGFYLYGLYSVAVFTRIDALLLKTLYITNKLVHLSIINLLWICLSKRRRIGPSCGNNVVTVYSIDSITSGYLSKERE